MRTTIDEVLRRARADLVRLSPSDAHAATRRPGVLLVDVRTPESRARGGHVPRALELSLNVLEWRLDPSSPTRLPGERPLDTLIILLCEHGYSSSLAAARLQQLGFARATDVVGGFAAWVRAGLPVVR